MRVTVNMCSTKIRQEAFCPEDLYRSFINKFPHIFYSCHAVFILTALTI